MVFGIPKEVFRDLLAHYRNLGVDAKLVEKDDPEAFNKETTVRISGRQFDAVILKFARGSMGGGSGFSIGPSISKKTKKMHPVLRFHHIVKGLEGKNEDDLKVEMAEKKKGIVSKKLVDIEWKGGKLAKHLNGDTDLRKMILTTGTTSLKVEPDRKNNCVRIIHQKGIDLVVESGGMFVKKTKARAENFPPVETLEIIDRISEHLKSV